MKLLVIIATIIGLSFVIYGASYPSLTMRYRLTLEAEVDGEPKIGSSVVEVTYAKQLNIGSELGMGYRGQAVILDLGSRGYLFALLKEASDSRSIPQFITFRAFNFPGGFFPGPTVEAGLKQIAKLSGKRELSLTSLPLLVRFRNIDDPMTVEKVDPIDIGKSFGEGARLVRAWLEIVPVGIWPLNLLGITGTSVTTGIEKKLKWLPQHYDVHFDGQRYETINSALPLANSLASGAFTTP